MWFVNHSVCDANATLNWTFDGGSPGTSTLKAPKVTYSNSGTYDVQLIVTQNGSSDTIVKQAFITTIPISNFPANENFELGSYAEGWKNIDAGNDGEAWEIKENTSGFGQGVYCTRFNNYSYDVAGKRDKIITRPLNGLQSGASLTLKFDVAYSRWAVNYSDTLAVYISYDCGNTLELLYLKGGTQLATAPDNSSNTFVPTNSQWRTDSVEVFSISSPGEEFVIVFENRGHYGQPIYLDNILIDADGVVTPIEIRENAEISLYPVPVEDVLNVASKGFNGQQLSYRIFDASARVCIAGQAIGEIVSVNTSMLSSGYYIFELSDGKKQIRKSFTKK
jgi:PKD repeat protein